MDQEQTWYFFIQNFLVALGTNAPPYLRFDERGQAEWPTLYSTLEQDPNDEPVSELLKRIKEEQEQKESVAKGKKRTSRKK